MSAEWTQSIFGCLANPCICIITFLAPCYRMGKIAEGLGDSCCIYTLCFFIPIVNIIVRYNQRSSIRERQGIDGSCCGDILCVLACAPCSMIQEGRETEIMNGGSMAQEVERA